jgi:hypothetical protein
VAIPIEAALDANGAYLHVEDQPLCSGCWSDGEVDAQVRRIKADLERGAEEMKALIRRNAGSQK